MFVYNINGRTIRSLQQIHFMCGECSNNVSRIYGMGDHTNEDGCSRKLGKCSCHGEDYKKCPEL